MATIKTTGTGSGLRVLTKTADGVQRVSCSCCEEAFCCPYPADQLGVGYTQDDLPDTIDVEGLILGVPERIIVSRSGSFYGPINQSIFNGTDFSEFIFVASDIEVRWFRNTTNGEPLGLGEPCLFQTLEEGAAILDTFADAYTIEFLDGKQVTVTRESLCSWFGTANIGGFEYEASLTYNDQTFEWEASFSTVDISSGLNSKDGNQNTPVGTYSGDNVITVSE